MCACKAQGDISIHAVCNQQGLAVLGLRFMRGADRGPSAHPGLKELTQPNSKLETASIF